MKRLILTSSVILLLVASCDSPITNSNTKPPSIQSPSNQLNAAAPAIPYSKKPVKPDSTRQAIWQRFKNENGKKWQVRWNAHTGLPASVFMGRTKKIYRGPAQEATQTFLAEHASLLGLSVMKHLQYVKTKEYKGMRYVIFNETVQGVPVYGAQYVVHLQANGQVNMVNGTYYPNIEISASPSVSAPAAISSAESDLDVAPKQN